MNKSQSIKFKPFKLLIVFIVLLLLSPIFWQLPLVVKENNLNPSPVWQVLEPEIDNINQTRGLHQGKLETTIAKITWNRPTLALNKLIRNTTILLDPNFYFFAEHPRERITPLAREKLLIINLPLLFYGLYLLLPNKYWSITFINLTLLFSSLGLTNNLAGLVLASLLLYPISIAVSKLFLSHKTYFYLYLCLALSEFIYWLVNYV